MGKPSIPEPPDYSEIAAASQAAAEMNFQIAQDQLAWAKETYAQGMEFLEPIMESYQQTLDFTQATAEADRQRYEELYQPLEDQLITEAQSYASPERLALEMGRAQAGVAQQYEASRQAAEQQLESYGLNPADTRYAALDIDTRTQQAAVSAQAGEQAYQQTQAKADALRSEALNIGKGYPGQVQAAYGTALQAGQQAVTGTNQSMATGSNMMTAPSAYMAPGVEALGTWGNTLHMGYQDQMAAYNAQLASTSGIGTVLGGLTSMVMPFAYNAAGIYAQEGGEIMPQKPMHLQPGGPVPAARSPSGGARPDDVPAMVSAGEFVVPEDVVRWKGSEYFYKELQKARESRAQLATPSGTPIPQPPKQPKPQAGGQQMQPAATMGARPAQQGALPVGGAMGGQPMRRPAPPPMGGARPGMAAGGMVPRGYADGGPITLTSGADIPYDEGGINQATSGAYYDAAGNLVVPREAVPQVMQQIQSLQPNNYTGLEQGLRTVRPVSAVPAAASAMAAPAAQSGLAAFGHAVQQRAPQYGFEPAPYGPPQQYGPPQAPRPVRPVAPMMSPNAPRQPPRPSGFAGAPQVPAAPVYPASPNAPRGAPPPSGFSGVPQVPEPFTRSLPQGGSPARTPRARPEPSRSSSKARTKGKGKSETKKREQITNDKAVSAFEFARQGQDYLRRHNPKRAQYPAIDTPLFPSARSK